MKGMDISQWQKGLKISDIKNAGYEFVILRGGYTGYGYDRTKNKDTLFETFYKEAKELDFPVGCYWYSCANTKQGGIDEANFLYENCLVGKQFEFPIYIDVEDTHWQNDDKDGVTDAIIGFCETLEDKGYYSGVYASLSWFKNKIDTSRLSLYTKWVAAWSDTQPTFVWTAFGIWQNSNNGLIEGMKVDTDYCFVDFPYIIKQAGLNGFKTPLTEVKKPILQIAQEVIKGEWGNGEDRKKRLIKAGYNYDRIQATVNGLLQASEITYTIQQGDTLSDIAQRYNTTVDYLVQKNDISDKDKIYVGQVLRI